jgi:hypothetical protein
MIVRERMQAKQTPFAVFLLTALFRVIGQGNSRREQIILVKVAWNNIHSWSALISVTSWV